MQTAQTSIAQSQQDSTDNIISNLQTKTNALAQLITDINTAMAQDLSEISKNSKTAATQSTNAAHYAENTWYYQGILNDNIIEGQDGVNYIRYRQLPSMTTVIDNAATQATTAANNSTYIKDTQLPNLTDIATETAVSAANAANDSATAATQASNAAQYAETAATQATAAANNSAKAATQATNAANNSADAAKYAAEAAQK